MEKLEFSELSNFNSLTKLTKEPFITNTKFENLKEVRKWNTNEASGFIEEYSFTGYYLTYISLKTYHEVNFMMESNHSFMVFSLKDNALTIANHKNVNVEEGIVLTQKKLECIITKNRKVELLIFSFDKSFFKASFVRSLELFNTIFPQSAPSVFEINNQIQKILWQIIENNKKGSSEYLYINGKIYELLTEVYEVRFPSVKMKDNKEEVLLKVKKIITTNLERQYSIPDLSKEVGMNASYLKRNFKEIFNETIFEFANRKRMQQAQVLLLSTALPIAIISEKVGYQHASHFSYAFKNSLGITPNKYRANHKKQNEAL